MVGGRVEGKADHSHAHGPLDAIETVEREGARLNRSRRLVAVIWVVAAVGILLMGLFVYPQWSQLVADSKELKILKKSIAEEPTKPLADVPVAILLPKTGSDAVGDNAKRQLEGFIEAFRKHTVRPNNQRILHFDYPIKIGSEAESRTDADSAPSDPKSVVTLTDMMNQIKTWYGEGVRTFIVTMSGATKELKREFVKWVEDEDDPLPLGDKPVLLATVASAPGIADRSNGVFRHYIRSSEETALLATYIESLHVTRVQVFYVADEYGNKAREDLERRLTSLSSDIFSFESYKVEVNFNKEAKEKVNRDIADILVDEVSKENAAVVVVGYGAMVEYTVSKLLQHSSEDSKTGVGHILVVSTLTEDKWRPDNLTDEKPRRPDERSSRRIVHTLEPVPGEMLGTTPGVVYQFSFHTLDRALQCKDKRGRDAFWQCWTDRHAHKENFMDIPGLSVEFTDDGDSDIALRLLTLYRAKPRPPTGE